MARDLVYGTLTVICGPMFSSKTKSLLKRILWARSGLEKDVLVVKPSFDDRYSDTRIVSHDGLSVNCHAITSWSEVKRKAEFADIVFIDELQFFEKPRFDDDIIEIVTGLLRQGKDVVANGLDLDVLGKPFRVTALMMAMADEVEKLTSNCSVCGLPATKTFKIDQPQDDGENIIQLGSVGVYEPRCNKHWVIK